MKCTKEEFSEYLKSLDVEPAEFWENFTTYNKALGMAEDIEKLLARSDSPAEAIDRAFNWAGTSRGNEYWSNVQHRSRNNRFDPKLFRVASATLLCGCTWNKHPIYCSCSR